MQVLSVEKNRTKVLMVICKGLAVQKYPIVNSKLQLWNGVIKDTARLDKENIVTVSWGVLSTDELVSDLRVSL